MVQKLRVGILFGGKSAEHEVSILSVKNVIEALDKNKYEPVLIGIDKRGEWHLCDSVQFLENKQGAKPLLPCDGQKDGAHLVSYSEKIPRQSLDVIFPVLHGTYGEDGTVQGLFKLADIPFVGAGVLGSAVGMDKDVMKRLLRDAGIPIAKFLTMHQSSAHEIDYKFVVASLGLPFFVKPANLGSSVGVSKMKNREDWDKAVELAFEYDHKIILEECINGKEIECSVLGNDAPIASLPGEVIPQHEFYSYEAKYLDDNGAHFKIPADLNSLTVIGVQNMAIRAYKALCCAGMARVDFFLRENGEIFVNELNTIPGFTKISMYPKMWEVSGIPYSELIDRLIELAIDRHQKEKKLKTHFEFDPQRKTV